MREAYREKISEGEIPFTFMTKVLQSIIDKIHEVQISSEYDWTKSDDIVKGRTKMDELIGEFEYFWKPNYKHIQEIYGKEVAKHLQKQLLIYHMKNNKGGFTDLCLWIHIGYDSWGQEEYNRLKEEVTRKDELSSYLS